MGVYLEEAKRLDQLKRDIFAAYKKYYYPIDIKTIEDRESARVNNIELLGLISDAWKVKWDNEKRHLKIDMIGERKHDKTLPLCWTNYTYSETFRIRGLNRSIDLTIL
jgi:hypothetical protein